MKKKWEKLQPIRLQQKKNVNVIRNKKKSFLNSKFLMSIGTAWNFWVAAAMALELICKFPDPKPINFPKIKCSFPPMHKNKIYGLLCSITRNFSDSSCGAWNWNLPPYTHINIFPVSSQIFWAINLSFATCMQIAGSRAKQGGGKFWETSLNFLEAIVKIVSFWQENDWQNK